MTARNWCFTLFSFAEMDLFQDFPVWFSAENKKKTRYVVYQSETCPDTGREHFQGYAEFYAPITMSMVKKVFQCPSMHLERRKGTQQEARDYCMKDESRTPGCEPIEWGVFGKDSQGKRSDLSDALQVLKQDGLSTLLDTYPEVYVKFHKGIAQLQYDTTRIKYETTMREVESTVLYGPPGSGKTYAAIHSCSEGNLTYFRLLPPTSKNGALWFDGYDNQQVIIVDEMKDWIPWAFLMNFMDQYPMMLPIKGGHRVAQFHYVIFTSNTHPKEWFPFYDKGMDWMALRRRISSIRYLQKTKTGSFEHKEMTDEDDANLFYPDLNPDPVHSDNDE